MDRARTLEALYDLVTDGGGIAVVGEGAPIPPPPTTTWRAAINTVLKTLSRRPAAAIGEDDFFCDNTLMPVRRPKSVTKRTSSVRASKISPATWNPFDVEWTVDSMHRQSLLDVVLQPARARRPRSMRSSAISVRRDSGGRAVRAFLKGEPPEFFAYMRGSAEASDFRRSSLSVLSAGGYSV